MWLRRKSVGLYVVIQLAGIKNVCRFSAHLARVTELFAYVCASYYVW
jgi:hypothetical protein